MDTIDRAQVRAMAGGMARERTLRERTLRGRVLSALSEGPATLQEIVATLAGGRNKSAQDSVRQTVYKLQRQGRVIKRPTFDATRQGRAVKCAPLDVFEVVA